MKKHESHSDKKVQDLREALEKRAARREQNEATTPAETSVGATNGEQDAQLSQMEGELAAAQNEAKEHYDKLLRLMAEFENYKRRQSRDLEERVQYANEKLLAELLPSIDDLDRVLEHVPEHASADARAIAEGIELTRKNLLSMLAKHDLKEVPALGELFDPAKHEAIGHAPGDGQPTGTVLTVHRRGYWLGNRLLRAALVTIAS